MKKIIKYSKLLPWLIILNLLSLPNLTFGAIGDYPPTPRPPASFETAEDVIDLIDRIVDYILFALVILSAAFIAFAGFTYVTAGGNEDKIKRAKNYLVWGVFGLVFVLGAKGVLWIIWNLIS